MCPLLSRCDSINRLPGNLEAFRKFSPRNSLRILRTDEPDLCFRQLGARVALSLGGQLRMASKSLSFSCSSALRMGMLSIPGPGRGSALAFAVLHVLFSSSNEEMIRTNAGRVVASMAAIKPLGDGDSGYHLKRDPGGSGHSAVGSTDQAVSSSALCSGPVPAISVRPEARSCVDLLPEAFCESFHDSTWRAPVFGVLVPGPCR